MSLFEVLLEIKTGKKNLGLKAIYIKNSKKKEKGNYYIYYYDETNDSYYINGLSKNKVITKKILQEIINRLFKRDSSLKKTPKVFLFYSSKDEAFICIDKIDLDVVRKSNLEIQSLIIKNFKSYS